jgi:hypothetical protein
VLLSEVLLHELLVEKFASHLPNGPAHCVALEVNGQGGGDSEGVLFGEFHL